MRSRLYWAGKEHMLIGWSPFRACPQPRRRRDGARKYRRCHRYRYFAHRHAQRHCRDHQQPDRVSSPRLSRLVLSRGYSADWLFVQCYQVVERPILCTLRERKVSSRCHFHLLWKALQPQGIRLHPECAKHLYLAIHGVRFHSLSAFSGIR